MTSNLLLVKDDFEYLKVPTQTDLFGNSSINYALMAVAQEVTELLQRAYPFQSDGIDRAKTIAIRAVEAEYMQTITIEPLTARELEVLQLIVDGHNNSAIARKLYITKNTVKAHVRNIMKKLYASDKLEA
ncbi:LuxR C-terminal-related transcriptional regulator [Scytonema sp. NUACC26]|uniref:LuxR C-terminal-related transcriptional regulator n=1 Tax=Scytonema sp. NUACC26 TaxID=3140176 RepID=UPI0034DC58D2